jgi:sec-independent protein translocase protein TatA
MLYAFGMPSTGSLILILVIVLVLFGTKRLRSAGGDLGGAIKNFKNSMKDAQENKEKDKTAAEQVQVAQDKSNVIDAESRVKDKTKA